MVVTGEISHWYTNCELVSGYDMLQVRIGSDGMCKYDGY